MAQRFELQRVFEIPSTRGVDRILTALFVPPTRLLDGKVVELPRADRLSRRDGSALAADGGAASRITGGASP